MVTDCWLAASDARPRPAGAATDHLAGIPFLSLPIIFQARTYQTLLVYAGRPVVTDGWLAASGLSGAFVEAAPDHLLVDPAAERREGFTLLSAHERAQAGRALDGATVLISPGACPEP